MMVGPWVYGSNRWLGEDVGPWVYGSEQVAPGRMSDPGFFRTGSPGKQVYSSKQVVGSWFRQLVERRRGGAPALPIRHSSSCVDRGCPMAVTATAASSFFDVAGGAPPPGSAPPYPRSPRPGSTRSTTISMRCRTPTCCVRRNAPRPWHTREVAEPHRGVSDRSGRCRRYCRGFPGPGRRHVWVPGGDRHRIPGSGGVGDGEHRQRPARPAGREGRLPGQYFGVACVSDPGPRPAIDDFTSKQAAIVGLAKLTDASEVRRVLQVAAEADNPTHLDLSLDQQRAKRSLRLSARANGMWAITGMLDEVDGAILAETLASFTRPRTPRHHHPGPTPR